MFKVSKHLVWWTKSFMGFGESLIRWGGSSKHQGYALFLCLGILFNSFNVLAIENPESELEQAGIFTNLGNQVDPSLKLIDSTGNVKSIGQLLEDDKPLILIPVYYKCPRLCGLILTGFAQLIKDLDLGLGKDFKVAAFSFNPEEGIELAAQKKAHYTSVLAEDEKKIDGWEFYVAESSQSKALLDQIGFRVLPDEGEFAHSAAIFILDKSGRISQFFAGIDFSESDVRLALVDASNGKIGNIMDQAMLFCFRFDPNQGKYTWAIGRLMQVVGALSILFLGGIIVRLLLKERNRLT